jgi:GNAT superfamily N-acetyltransferase
MQLPNGYYQLPPGKMANAVTWMELKDLLRPAEPAPAGFTLRQLRKADATLHRKLYRDIGEPWLWSGLLMKGKSEMEAYLADAKVLSFAVFENSKAIGMLDLETSHEGVEIVYFGLAPAHTGMGAGGWLMAETICNFDHPKAIVFYQKQGFAIYAQGFEIMDDPRRDGLLPKSAAPHVPRLD